MKSNSLLIGLFLTISFLNFSFAKKESFTFISEPGEFVKLDTDNEVYYRYKPAKSGHKTIVFLNGLTHSTKDWEAFLKYYLQLDPHSGVLLYDMTGMGESMKNRFPELYTVPVENQVNDLSALLKYLEVNEAVELVGLSYGGGVGIQFAAAHPEQVDNLVLMAPYVAPIREQHYWIETMIHMARRFPPWSFIFSKVSNDELYEYFFRLIVTTFPSAETSLLEEPQWLPYKLELIFQMANGIRKLLAEDIIHKLPKGSLHLWLAKEDEYVENAEHLPLWEKSPNNVKGSRIFFEYTKHKIPQEIPETSAYFLNKLIKGDPELHSGKTLIVDPTKKVITTTRESEKTCDGILE
ncbi:MAG: alpha/beta hydrolase [Bdellovibrionales bacterium]|nr:alpha/beta hydrolase [Bdellovibrionales bacterium]